MARLIESAIGWTSPPLALPTRLATIIMYTGRAYNARIHFQSGNSRDIHYPVSAIVGHYDFSTSLVSVGPRNNAAHFDPCCSAAVRGMCVCVCARACVTDNIFLRPVPDISLSLFFYFFHSPPIASTRENNSFRERGNLSIAATVVRHCYDNV